MKKIIYYKNVQKKEEGQLISILQYKFLNFFLLCIYIDHLLINFCSKLTTNTISYESILNC